MRNAVGREIPDEILRATGKEVFAGSYAHDDRCYQKAAPKAHGVCDPHRSKLVSGIREVLERCGIDTSIYSGFAFGVGLERIVMRRFAINDLRLLYENDLRFLDQF